MVFARQHLIQKQEHKIANVKIEQKTEARLLGVIIDENLTWSKHFFALKPKMSRYLEIMYRIKNQLPIQARLQIYHSFAQSHLNYCSIVWGFAEKILY